MAESINYTYISNLVTKAGEDFLKDNGNSKGKPNMAFNFSLNKIMMNALIKIMIEKDNTDKDEIIEKLMGELKLRDNTIAEQKSEINELRYNIDCTSQFSRREHLKITGIPYEETENVNQIVKDLAKHTMGIELEDKDISVAHRIHTKKDQVRPNATTVEGTQNGNSSIMVRYVVRNMKANQLGAKKYIRDKAGYKYPNAAIYEDVTPTRSRIMFELRNKKDKDNNRVFKYVWSKDGRIFIRIEDEAKQGPMPKPRSLQRPEDLKKYGWTDQEIENIIINKRD